MDLIVDTNVVSSAVLADGTTRELLIGHDLDLWVPEYFSIELSTHLELLEARSGLSRPGLDLLLELLFEQIDVVPREEFESELAEARGLIESVDPDDVPFLALAIHLDAAIWSDDEHFQ